MYKNILQFLLIILICCFIAHSKSADDYVATDLECMAGSWVSEGSVCEIKINPIGSFVEVEVIDTSKLNYTIVVSDIKWDGQTLSFSSLCLENRWQTDHCIRLINPCNIENRLSKNNVKLIFRKKQCQQKNGT